MGSVWCARDVVLERRVALKELVHFERHHDAVQVTERRKRAVVEARALARVSHPAIVRIHDIFFTDSDPWIVMEYIKGRSLAAIIRDGSLGEREIARIGLPVLRGLSAAHAAEVVHRDVKPTNILVTDNSEVFLVDFGIAKISGDMSLTGHSKVLGTPEYLAPEQILGKPVGAPADLWALGVTFFCALEGYSPFRRDGDRPEAATMMAVLQADLPQPMRPGRLSKIVTRLLQKEPEQRADAAELSLALQAILDDGAPARPRPATPSAAAQPQTQTQPHMPAPSGWPAQPPPRRQPASPQSPYQQQRPPEQQPSRQQPPRQSPPPPPGWQPAPSPARPAARSSRDSATVAAQGPAVDAVRQAAPQEAAAMLLG